MEVSGFLERRLFKTKQREAASLSIALFLATGGGLGSLPLAPGSWASLLTAALWYLVYRWVPGSALIIHVVSLILLVPLAWIASGLAARALGQEDPSRVVIDEIVGQSIPLLFVPAGVWWCLGGFALFRLFDVVKPPPVKQCERVSGGLGILLDDCAAGLCAGLVLWLIHAS